MNALTHYDYIRTSPSNNYSPEWYDLKKYQLFETIQGGRMSLIVAVGDKVREKCKCISVLMGPVEQVVNLNNLSQDVPSTRPQCQIDIVDELVQK